MRLFGEREVRQARAHAGAGGQALHVFRWGWWPGAPAVFLAEGRAGRPWAHLFDADAERLAATARRLGVRRVVVHGRGSSNQHVDLCGRPLRRAMAEATEGDECGPEG